MRINFKQVIQTPVYELENVNIISSRYTREINLEVSGPLGLDTVATAPRLSQCTSLTIQGREHRRTGAEQIHN